MKASLEPLGPCAPLTLAPTPALISHRSPFTLTLSQAVEAAALHEAAATSATIGSRAATAKAAAKRAAGIASGLPHLNPNSHPHINLILTPSGG